MPRGSSLPSVHGEIMVREVSGTVTVTPIFGGAPMCVPINDQVIVGDIKRHIQTNLGIPTSLQAIWSEQESLLDDSTPVIAGANLRVSSTLRGGATAGCGTITDIPRMCNIQICCWRFGVMQLPSDLCNSPWCWNSICCFHQTCGTDELRRFQFCCCKGFWCNRCDQTTQYPDCCQLRCLFWKCFLLQLPDCERQDCCVSAACCLHSEFGMARGYLGWQLCCVGGGCGSGGNTPSATYV